MNTLQAVDEYWYAFCTNYSSFEVYFYLLLFTRLIVYFGIGSLWTAIDILCLKMTSQYKIQPNRNSPPSIQLIKDMYLTAFINLGIIDSIMSCLYYIFFLCCTIIYNKLIIGDWYIISLGDIYYNTNIPFTSCKSEYFLSNLTLFTLFKYFSIFAICTEIVFYHNHKWCHTNEFLYQNVHKLHHSVHSPIAISAVYCHPIEHVIVNTFSVISGFIVFALIGGGSHIIIASLWASIVLISTLHAHSGYHFPFVMQLIGKPEFHDFHHKSIHYNFGVFGLCDWYYGTDKGFKQSIESKFNKIYWNFYQYPKEKQQYLLQKEQSKKTH